MSNFYGYGNPGMTSNKQDWETPKWLFDKLNEKYSFTWDLASSVNNAKSINYFTEGEDSLNQDWSSLKGNLFLNPPYGRSLKKWVKKASETSLDENQKLVMLIPARTDTSYWHDYIFDKAEIHFLRGRLKFEKNGIPGNSATFGSAIVIYSGSKEK